MLKNITQVCLISLLWNCQEVQVYRNIIKNGDIIFVEAKKENLSGAISRVTKSEKNIISYDHVALVEITKTNQNILHSSTKNGSEKLSLRKFIKKNKKENRQMDIYRLKTPYQKCINEAMDRANAMLGHPYNFLYIPNENSYYCSDFVERAYRNCDIFQLHPMTFINPSTGKIDDFWANLYQSKNIEIPEGKLGCNPNGISQSNKIEKILTIK